MAAPAEPPLKILNCKDPKTGTGSRCWGELKVDHYLMQWKAKNVPATCKEGEAWSICFDRLATTNLKQDCTQINSTKCEPFDPESHYLSPQWYYGAFNTWCKYKDIASNTFIAHLGTQADMNRIAINQYFTRWYKAIDTISREHPATIYAAAQPQDIDVFVAANKKQELSIDVALRNLISTARETPQTHALVGAMKAFPSFVTYNSSNVEKNNPPVATFLKTRLEQLLRQVESDLPAFLAMAKNGTFSQKSTLPEVAAVEGLVDQLYPEGAAMVSIDSASGSSASIERE
ncbi:MAG: hypothetical protein LQ346_000322 [Caloplaca aetnensis]|nr:MAG: hypothetical protein LQ346_000322 [Caloplaca aetnensis]